MWRAKLQKWCSNSLSICSSYFLNTTVALHKGRAIVVLHTLKKSYPPFCLFFLFSTDLLSLPFSVFLQFSLLCWNLSAAALGFLSQPISQLSIPSPFPSPFKKKSISTKNPFLVHFIKTQLIPILSTVIGLGWSHGALISAWGGALISVDWGGRHGVACGSLEEGGTVWLGDDFCWFWKRGVDLVDWERRHSVACGSLEGRNEEKKKKNHEEMRFF